MQVMLRHRYLAARRSSQFMILFLFIAGNLYGLKVLQGNLSTSKVFGTVHLADPFALLQISAAGSIVSLPALIGAGIVLILFAIFGGRMFCSWVCPLNIITDIAVWLREQSLFSDLSGHQFVSRDIRYWAMGIALILSALTGVAAFEWISPISKLHRGVIYGMGAGWSAVAAVFLFDLFVVRNGFCGHICPLGGFYAIAGRYSLLRVSHNKGRCTLCMKCIEHCPESQVLPMVGKRNGLVLSGECTNCGKCIEVCDDRAMEFTLRLSPGRHC